MRHLQLSCFAVIFLTAAITQAADSPAVTFAEHIAPIVHSKCTMCHREGQPGPFELRTFEDVRDRGETIQAVIHDKYMPPWKPVNDGVQYAHDRRLTEKEFELFDAWVEGGMPSGDLRTVKIPSYPSGWSLGKPDLVLKMNGRFKVPASGRDIYRSFVFEAALAEDKWVKAVELRPKARGAVHHAIFFVDTTGQAREQDGQDGQAGLAGMQFLRGGNRDRGSRRRSNPNAGSALGVGALGGYIPGSTPNKLPGDLAMFLPKGGDVVMQTHFHPSGKVEYEEAELALYFADKPPSRQLVAIQLPPLFGRMAGLDVPAGKKDFEISQSFTLPVDVEAIQIGGHAHYICREMEIKATLPDGTKIELLTIDDWDLDWQDQYQFAKPYSLPAGTKLDARLLYDNSAENPENPHSPPRRIKWGRESTDEMGSITLQVVAKNESDSAKLQRSVREMIARSLGNAIAQRSGQFGRNLRGMGGNTIVKRWDRNGDGQLQKDEVPQRSRDRVFNFADKNNDGVIDKFEVENALKALRGGR